MVPNFPLGILLILFKFYLSNLDLLLLAMQIAACENSSKSNYWTFLNAKKMKIVYICIYLGRIEFVKLMEWKKKNYLIEKKYDKILI